ncbi:MAG: hypothetical protein BWY49_00367 [Candidatus Omnitrophica bacterium ADurb.Bin314]|nr:MAG: hypothetical protein BWY49_00367 [Candidatus Omnitrophica bacterium ADurb.Bin314]
MVLLVQAFPVKMDVRGDQFFDRKMEVESADQLHDGSSRAAEREGVLAAGGFDADPERSRQKVNTVEDSEESSQKRHGSRNGPVVLGKVLRQVLRADRLGHGFLFPRFDRVFPADDPLKVRHLVNEVGHQIDLGKTGGPDQIDGQFFLSGRFREDRRQFLEPFRFIQHGSKLPEIDQLVQKTFFRLQFFFRIRIMEITGILQTRLEYVLVIGADSGKARPLPVHNGNEPVHRTTLRVIAGKDLLVLLHAAREYFGRQIKILPGKSPLQQERLFRQMRVDMDQLLVDLPLTETVFQGAADDFLAFAEVQLHVFALEKPHVGLPVGLGNRKRLRGEEPVAKAHITGLHIRDLHRDFPGIGQDNEPADRPRKTKTGPVPTHEFRESK